MTDLSNFFQSHSEDESDDINFLPCWSFFDPIQNDVDKKN